jgi:hypothetical protein
MCYKNDKSQTNDLHTIFSPCLRLISTYYTCIICKMWQIQGCDPVLQSAYIW